MLYLRDGDSEQGSGMQGGQETGLERALMRRGQLQRVQPGRRGV